MGEYKTPGVYIKEKNAFGNSVVEAETAIPAFIGYTQKALNGSDDLTGKPWKINSMTEFIQYFGTGPDLKFVLDVQKRTDPAQNGGKTDANAADPQKNGEEDSGKTEEKKETEEKEESASGDLLFSYPFTVVPKEGEEGEEFYFTITGARKYSLYYQMQLFFANGGSTCYVVSLGSHNDTPKKNDYVGALDALRLEREITMVVFPDAAALSIDDFADVQKLALMHCGEMMNRFAILDIYPKAAENTRIDEQVNTFQEKIGSNFLSYGAAYFPWLNTSVLSEKDLSGDMFVWKDSVETYKDMIGDEAFSRIIGTFYNLKETLTLKKKAESSDEKTDEITKNGYIFKFEGIAEGEIKVDKNKVDKNKVIGKISNLKPGNKDKVETKTFDVEWSCFPTETTDKKALHLALYNASPLYKQAVKTLLGKLNLLPPSAAMAGIYTMVDGARGVWKAPANVSLNYVTSPAEDIDNDEQEGLNAPMSGKAVNVIRTFRGEGVKVWGARTLDGNSLDWRYVNVRRTLLFLEESVRNAARAYVFEPNDAGTWINMKCMIENFLRSVWKRGGLAGATPEDAFEVHVGLGDTMTGEDILEGIMRITVLVAVTRPAEFIEITFQQQMQKS